MYLLTDYITAALVAVICAIALSMLGIKFVDFLLQWDDEDHE